MFLSFHTAKLQSETSFVKLFFQLFFVRHNKQMNSNGIKKYYFA